MIIDRFSNIGMYTAILPGLKEGLAALAALGEKPETGRFEFPGGYFMVQEGSTREISEGEFEAHRKYVDVQIVLEGQEEIAWSHLSAVAPAGDYLPEKDRQMFTGAAEQCNRITEGMVWIAFPEDAHKACRHITQQTSYRKVVMKLPV